MTCLRHESGGENARYVFIRDRNAPKFNLNVELYAKQLDKGLVANVLDAGVWGSYRFVRLGEQNSVPCEHAYVNTLTRGDLSSLRWFNSPLSLDRSGGLLCNTYYVSLNFR